MIEWDTLLRKIDVLESKINSLEQKNLQNYVDVVGIPDIDNTNCGSKVVELLENNTNEKITKNDIEDCFVNRIKRQDNINLNIVCVRFVNHSIKTNILNSLRKNKVRITVRDRNERESKVFINERLTKYNRSLLKKCLVRDGKILVRKDEGGSVLSVKSYDDIAKI